MPKMNPHLFATSLSCRAVIVSSGPSYRQEARSCGPLCLHVAQARRMCLKDSVCKVRVPFHGTVAGHTGGWEAISEHRM